MMRQLALFLAGLLMISAAPAPAQVTFDGFLQGLYGGRLDKNNPTATEQTASETRLQLRVQHTGASGEFFGRLDFVFDGADTASYDWELREGYLKFRLGSRFDFKVGRQVLTWGTGDLIFINDVFAKDYRSFFVGRDDQYLKEPQNALRSEYYSPLGELTLVWSPRFEPNRLPTGDRLSYYNPFVPGIVGTGLSPLYYFDPPQPEPEFKNAEIAARLSRDIGGFNVSLYAYHGFYKNPMGAYVVMVDNAPQFVPYYPRLNVFGASARGTLAGGVLWTEGGYLDSRDDRDGKSPLVPNSSVTGLLGFERQVATNLTANIQWQLDYMTDYDKFSAQQPQGVFVRDEVRHLLTSRITKLAMSENLTLSAFGFYSPTDEDIYVRLSAAYKYTDEITIAAGGNLFAGRHENTDFGQFQKNDNVYLKLTYNY
ncbi:MAG: DUF1302 family protein [Candidatus Zixiibacteriota bacterium]